VLESFERLRVEADLVLVEGAGSASEINLREGDIANMGFARAAGVPVAIIGDIDRGGVIAQIVGTRCVIAPEDAAMVVGFLINKFRGDASLFAEGLALIEQRTGWPSLGMIPHFAAAQKLPAEDAMALERPRSRHDGVTIAVPRLAHIANFDEFDPLRLEPEVDLVMVAPGAPLPVCDLVILPGSKATIADLAFFREQGWDIDLFAHVRRGGRVLGLCGGYQMLGRRIADPAGTEGPAGEVAGLGLLDVETTMQGDKALVAVSGTCLANGAQFDGYEMHVGRTTGPGTRRPLLRYSDGRTDGVISPDGLVMGGYAHGLFAADSQRAAWLATLGVGSALAYEAMVERTLDELAAHISGHVDLDRLMELAR
jgi:adenosylcobyric acid synthase